MLSQDLYENVLIAPARSGATELLIVSGYATAAMADKHLKEDTLSERGVRIRLVYGMAKHDGVRQVDHARFLELQRRGFFECHYRIVSPRIHAKVYIWLKDNSPFLAFAGSANYSQTAFLPSSQQTEVMIEANPDLAAQFFLDSLHGSMEIEHDDIADNVQLTTVESALVSSGQQETISLLTSNGDVGRRSGLNWGQREGRNPNQAYIRVPVAIGKSDFFPERARQFTVLTDDGMSFIAVVAQENGKAIHTPDGNNVLGEYFRRRIGVELGSYVTRGHLERYGRTDVTFIKLDDETFWMDFAIRD